jgi:hypothetical protein
MALSGYPSKVIVTVINLPFLIPLLALTASAQALFDPEAYRQLADASSAQTIAVRTTITVQNWTTYRPFIAVGLRNAFSGKYPIRIGSEPLYVVEISPSQHFGQPRKFLEDTEKYLGQAQLVQSLTGGFTLSPLPGQTAGLPFGPNPAEPNLALKVLYNYWLAYQPRISNAISTTWSVDSSRNAGQHSTNITAYRLSHLSAPGFPAALPYAQDYLSCQRNVVLTPEEKKYNTSLKLWYNDPARIPELYSFVPSMRRSLRLSAAARCRPMGVTDFVEDDSGFQIPNFKATLLGVKKLIARIQDPAKGFDPAAYDLTGSFPGWPNPGTGTWQVRDVYVVDVSPLPVMGSYCYSHKVLYIDKETWMALFSDSYDDSGKFWKLFRPKYAPMRVGDALVLAAPAGLASGEMLDFKKNHASVSIQNDITVDEKVPDSYQDAQRLAFPAGLNEVNQ